MERLVMDMSGYLIFEIVMLCGLCRCLGKKCGVFLVDWDGLYGWL